MEKNLGWHYSAIILSVVILSFLFLQVTGKGVLDVTANVILNDDEIFFVGDSFNGVVEFRVNEEIIENDFPVILLMTKNSSVVFVENLELSYVLEVSEKRGDVYSVNLENLVDYSYVENGEYEFLFSILDLDFFVKRKISVS